MSVRWLRLAFVFILLFTGGFPISGDACMNSRDGAGGVVQFDYTSESLHALISGLITEKGSRGNACDSVLRLIREEDGEDRHLDGGGFEMPYARRIGQNPADPQPYRPAKKSTQREEGDCIEMPPVAEDECQDLHSRTEVSSYVHNIRRNIGREYMDSAVDLVIRVPNGAIPISRSWDGQKEFVTDVEVPIGSKVYSFTV